MSTRKPYGFTLPELVLLIVVLSIAIAGVMVVFTTAVRGSADPLVAKQGLAIAEALVEEIQLASYAVQPGTGTVRQDFDDVLDYHGYATAGGMVGIDGVAIPGLSAFNVASIAVTATALNGVGEAFRIVVTVSGPGGFSISLEGYKVNYP
jgi:MSHA pilin protein MshD